MPVRNASSPNLSPSPMSCLYWDRARTDSRSSLSPSTVKWDRARSESRSSLSSTSTWDRERTGSRSSTSTAASLNSPLTASMESGLASLESGEFTPGRSTDRDQWNGTERDVTVAEEEEYVMVPGECPEDHVTGQSTLPSNQQQPRKLSQKLAEFLSRTRRPKREKPKFDYPGKELQIFGTPGASTAKRIPLTSDRRGESQRRCHSESRGGKMSEIHDQWLTASHNDLDSTRINQSSNSTSDGAGACNLTEQSDHFRVNQSAPEPFTGTNNLRRLIQKNLEAELMNSSDETTCRKSTGRDPNSQSHNIATGGPSSTDIVFDQETPDFTIVTNGPDSRAIRPRFGGQSEDPSVFPSTCTCPFSVEAGTGSFNPDGVTAASDGDSSFQEDSCRFKDEHNGHTSRTLHTCPNQASTGMVLSNGMQPSSPAQSSYPTQVPNVSSTSGELPRGEGTPTHSEISHGSQMFGDARAPYMSRITDSQLCSLNSVRAMDTGEFQVQSQGQGYSLEGQSRGYNYSNSFGYQNSDVSHGYDDKRNSTHQRSDDGSEILAVRGSTGVQARKHQVPQIAVNGSPQYECFPADQPRPAVSRSSSRIVASQQQALEEVNAENDCQNGAGEFANQDLHVSSKEIPSSSLASRESPVMGDQSALINQGPRASGRQSQTTNRVLAQGPESCSTSALPKNLPFANPKPFVFSMKREDDNGGQDRAQGDREKGKGKKNSCAGKHDGGDAEERMGGMKDGRRGGTSGGERGRWRRGNGDRSPRSARGDGEGRNQAERRNEQAERRGSFGQTWRRTHSSDPHLVPAQPRANNFRRYQSEDPHVDDIMRPFLATYDTLSRPRYFDAYLCVPKVDLDNFGIPFLKQLENEYNFKIFIPERDLLLGDHLFEALSRVVKERCRCKVIVVLSKGYFDSAECLFLTHFAKTLDPDARRRSIIPVIIDHIEDRIPHIIQGLALIRYNHDYLNGWLESKIKDAIRC